jgi:hypothetical protein
MTRCTGRLLVGAGALAAALVSCSRPLTDIVATSTEDVGDYEVIDASGTDRLKATVCVAQTAHAEVIAERLVRQWANHGIDEIALEIVGPPQDGGVDVVHFTWAAGDGARITNQGRGARSPCTVTRGRVARAAEAESRPRH